MSAVSDLEARLAALTKAPKAPAVARPLRAAPPQLPKAGPLHGISATGAASLAAVHTPPTRASTPPRSRAPDRRVGSAVMGAQPEPGAGGPAPGPSAAVAARKEEAEQAKVELESSLRNALDLRAQLFEMVGASADVEELNDEQEGDLDEETAETIAELQSEINQLKHSLAAATRGIIAESKVLRAWGSSSRSVELDPPETSAATTAPEAQVPNFAGLNLNSRAGPEPEPEPESEPTQSQAHQHETALVLVPDAEPKLQAPPLLPLSQIAKLPAWADSGEDESSALGGDDLSAALAGLGIRELRKRAMAAGVDHDLLEDATFGNNPREEVIALIKAVASTTTAVTADSTSTVRVANDSGAIAEEQTDGKPTSAISTTVSVQHAAPPPTPMPAFEEIEAELANEGEMGYGLDIAPDQDGCVEVTAVDVGSRAETTGVLVGDQLVSLRAANFKERSVEDEKGEQAIDLVCQIVQEMEVGGATQIVWTFRRAKSIGLVAGTHASASRSLTAQESMAAVEHVSADMDNGSASETFTAQLSNQGDQGYGLDVDLQAWPNGSKHVVVVAVDDGSLAQQSGIEPGDELVSLDGQECKGDIDLVFALVEELETAPGFGGSIAWAFQRDQNRHTQEQQQQGIVEDWGAQAQVDEAISNEQVAVGDENLDPQGEDSLVAVGVDLEMLHGNSESDEIVALLTNEGEGGYGLDIDLAESGGVEVVGVDAGSNVESYGVRVGDMLVRIGDVEIPTSSEGDTGDDPIKMVYQVVEDMEAAGHQSIEWAFYQEPLQEVPIAASKYSLRAPSQQGAEQYNDQYASHVADGVTQSQTSEYVDDEYGFADTEMQPVMSFAQKQKLEEATKFRHFAAAALIVLALVVLVIIVLITSGNF